MPETCKAAEYRTNKSSRMGTEQKVAVITAASQGIGPALVTAYLERNSLGTGAAQRFAGLGCIMQKKIRRNGRLGSAHFQGANLAMRRS
jgi:hypothetical protein